jgi:hypothetical protein
MIIFLTKCLRDDNDLLIGKIGSMFRVNHWLLNALGVGHPSLTAVYDTSNMFDLACKLTGAGGGGCAITLLKPSSRTDSSLENLQSTLASQGFVSFFSEVGGAGVKWHTEFPIDETKRTRGSRFYRFLLRDTTAMLALTGAALGVIIVARSLLHKN